MLNVKTAAAMLTIGILAIGVIAAKHGRALEDHQDRVAPSSFGWMLPVDKARSEARSHGRPLLIVSLNGNLDGYC